MAVPLFIKSTSLATSLAYDYYLSGFLGCWAFWFLLIGLISYTSDRFILNENQILNFIYKGTTGLLIIISILSIYITIQTSTGSNIEWHADITKRAKEWGMHCDGEFKFLAN